MILKLWLTEIMAATGSNMTCSGRPNAESDIKAAHMRPHRQHKQLNKYWEIQGNVSWLMPG